MQVGSRSGSQIASFSGADAVMGKLVSVKCQLKNYVQLRRIIAASQSSDLTYFQPITTSNSRHKIQQHEGTRPATTRIEPRAKDNFFRTFKRTESAETKALFAQ